MGIKNDDILRKAITKAVNQCGGQTRYAKKIRASQSRISDILKGADISDRYFERIFPTLEDRHFEKGWTKKQWLDNKTADLILPPRTTPTENPETEVITPEEIRLLRHFRFVSGERKEELLRTAVRLSREELIEEEDVVSLRATYPVGDLSDGRMEVAETPDDSVHDRK